MATKKTKRPAVPEAVALRKLEHLVSRTSPERKPELRATVRRVLALPDPGAHDHAPILGNTIHSLQLAVDSMHGPDPEAALVYLSFGVERLALLVEHVLAELGAARASRSAA